MSKINNFLIKKIIIIISLKLIIIHNNLITRTKNLLLKILLKQNEFNKWNKRIIEQKWNRNVKFKRQQQLSVIIKRWQKKILRITGKK